MRFFAHSDKVFDGNQTTGKREDHIDCHETSKLEPRKGRAINAKPHRLADYNICRGGNFIRETFMKKVNDGKDGTGKRQEC